MTLDDQIQFMLLTQELYITCFHSPLIGNDLMLEVCLN